MAARRTLNMVTKHRALIKHIGIASAVLAVVWISFIYAAINTMCDDDHWPEWA
jgi:hypothetical protein